MRHARRNGGIATWRVVVAQRRGVTAWRRRCTGVAVAVAFERAVERAATCDEKFPFPFPNGGGFSVAINRPFERQFSCYSLVMFGGQQHRENLEFGGKGKGDSTDSTPSERRGAERVRPQLRPVRRLKRAPALPPAECALRPSLACSGRTLTKRNLAAHTTCTQHSPSPTVGPA